MRERGVQSRRDRPPKIEPTRRPPPEARASAVNVWQIVAIIALIAATAGWTTVAVLALRPASSPSTAATESTDPGDLGNASEEPPPHDVPDFEAVMPAQVSGTALNSQSWTGDNYLATDPWDTSMIKFLTDAGKTSKDLQIAQADPAPAPDSSEIIDLTVLGYRVGGIDGPRLHDAVVAAWKAEYPEMTTSQVTIGGVPVTKGDFGQDTASTYLVTRGDVVYDIETADAALAESAIFAIQNPGASAPPAASSSTAASPNPGTAAPSVSAAP